MAEIFYCDRCGLRIPQSDLASGRAAVTPAGVVCAACAKAPPPAGAPGPAPRVDAQPRRQSTRATAPRDAGPPPGKKHTSGLAIAGVGAGVLVGIAAALLLAGGSKEHGPKRSSSRTSSKPSRQPSGRQQVAPPALIAPKPSASPSTANSARARLREITTWRGSFPGRYAEMRKALVSFPDEFPDAREVAEAKKLLAEIDEEHAKLAFGAYWEACESAYALVAKGRHDEAASALRSVGARFGESPWHRKVGERRVATMLAKVEAARGDAATRALARAREGIEAKAFAAAREALGARASWHGADRAEAEKLLGKINELESAAKAERARAAKWRAFLAELREVGKKGVPEVESLLARERKGFAADGRGDEYTLIERRTREAKRVEEYAEIGLSGSRRSLRATWKGQPVAGKVLEIKKGVMKLRTSLGKVLDIPIAELAPRDVEAAVGKSLKSVDVANYYLVRGDLDGARKLLAGVTGKKADALRDAIDEVQEATKAPPGPAPGPPALAGKPEPVTQEHRPGLLAEYYEGRDLAPASLKVTRIERNIELDWGDGAPDPKLPADGFSMRLTGELNVPADGDYEFFVERDDGARLWVDNVAVIDKWARQAGQDSGIGVLKAGWVPIKLEFMEIVGQANLKLSWKGPGLAMRIIPSEAFRTRGGGAAVAVVVAPPAAKPPRGPAADLPKGPREPLPGETGKPGQWAPGLVAEIFEGADFRKRVGVRIDRNIDFEFAEAGPDLDMPGRDYSIRWTGWLLIPSTGEYVFDARGDDSLEVTLDGKPLVKDKWDKTGATPPLLCEAGLHPITATLSQSRDWARAELKWKRPGTNNTDPIPAEYFFHEVPASGSMGPFAKLCQGVLAEYYMGENFQRKVGEAVLRDFHFDAGNVALFVRQNAVFRDRFSVRMTGYLHVEKQKNCRFEIDADDGARLFVGGEKIAERWDSKSNQKIFGSKRLGPGFHKIVVEYLEKVGGAKLYVRYERWGMSDVRPNILYREASAGRAAAKALVLDRRGLAPGLKGALYAAEKPGTTKPALKTLDPDARFEWWRNSPGAGISNNRFSGTWQGALLVPRGGQYVFRVRHQGGAKLVVAGRTLINKGSATEGWAEANLKLPAGPVQLQLGYAEKRKNKDSTLIVYWSGPGLGYQTIGPAFVAHPEKGLPLAKAWEKAKAAPAKVAAGGPARPGGAPAGVRPLPGAAGKKPAEPMPEGNLVANGSFEKVGEDKFTSGWRKWLEGGRQASVRTDKTDSHTGDNSLSVKTFAEGMQAGAWSTIAKTLPPGKYVARYWACAEVGKARIVVSLGDEEISTGNVGEDWTQVKTEFEVAEKKVRPSVRIYVTTPRVKVWLDDVEVEAVK